MRLELQFQVERNDIAIEVNRIILSFLKNSIANCNSGKYFEEIFNDTKQKDYCYSIKLPSAKFLKDHIELEEKKFRVFISINDKSKIAFILFSALIGMKNKQFKIKNGNSMKLISITNNQSQKIRNNRIFIKFEKGSPLCVRDHCKETNKDKYYVFNDDEFREKFKVVIENQLKKAGFYQNKIDEFNFNSIDCKKIVIKNYNRYIDTTVGLFEFEGDIEILQYLYDVGVGSRSSMGFGMVNLVTQDLV